MGYANCVKLSQPYNSGSLFVTVWTQARQQTVKLIEAAELDGQLATALGRQLDLHTQAQLVRQFFFQASDVAPP